VLALWAGQTRMRVVIGRAIAVPKIEHPSHELIEEYLQRFIASMMDLYERHADAAGYHDRKLLIL
jgi:Diacylglycerol acyltransferase